jgi:hypothetical protein
MRAALPLSAILLAACAPRTPLDLIPRADLLMIEAAERMEQQSPLAVRAPAAIDLDAQYAAALAAAGITPFALGVAEQAAVPDTASPPLPPRRPVDATVAPVPAVLPASPEREAPANLPAVAPTAMRPISVDEMLSRVRSQAAPKP